MEIRFLDLMLNMMLKIKRYLRLDTAHVKNVKCWKIVLFVGVRRNVVHVPPGKIKHFDSAYSVAKSLLVRTNIVVAVMTACLHVILEMI